MPPKRGSRSWLGRIFWAAVASGLALAAAAVLSVVVYGVIPPPASLNSAWS